MSEYPEKRRCLRKVCKIPIPVHVSFFHSLRVMEAVLIDHCLNGICFLSEHAFLERTPVVLKVDYCMVNGSDIRDLEILPSVSLGEVRWCRRHPAETSSTYGVGVQFYPEVY